VNKYSVLRYVKKTHRILFSKCTKYEWEYAKEVASSGVQEEELKLEKMAKRRSCIICKYDFKEGIKTDGRRNPKLTQFECTTCTPAVALCRPQGSECWKRRYEKEDA